MADSLSRTFAHYELLVPLASRLTCLPNDSQGFNERSRANNFFLFKNFHGVLLPKPHEI